MKFYGEIFLKNSNQKKNPYNFYFEDLFLEIENTQVQNAKWEDRKDFKLNKIMTFVYSSIMDFPRNKFEIKTFFTK